MNAYHDWLCRKRIYCEHPGCMDTFNKGVVVRQINGRDTVLCKWHGHSLNGLRAQRVNKERKEQSV